MTETERIERLERAVAELAMSGCLGTKWVSPDYGQQARWGIARYANVCSIADELHAARAGGPEPMTWTGTNIAEVRAWLGTRGNFNADRAGTGWAIVGGTTTMVEAGRRITLDERGHVLVLNEVLA